MYRREMIEYRYLNRLRFFFILWILPSLFHSIGYAAMEPSSGVTFTNPIVESGADPWVIQWENEYLYCFSRNNRIWVNRAKQLTEIGKGKPVCVWEAPPNTEYSKQIWAPELHRLERKWYIYFAASDGDNHNHRMYVIENASEDPQALYTFKGKIADSSDRWAIDGTVLQMPDERLYFIWSGWEGDENIQQNLYIAPMSDPWTISGERVCLSEPEYAWEKHGRPLVNEGPQVLKNGEKIFIIYSASGSWTDEYCLGQLTWTGGYVMQIASWEKKPTPVFSKTEHVFGPGHASFVKSPSGEEDWIVYHAAKHSGAGWNRNVRMQRFSWDDGGDPKFGEPVAEGVQIPVPE